MEKIGAAKDSITIEEEPLDDYLAEEEAKTKENEATAAREREQAEKKKAKRRRSPVYYAEGTKRVSKRVRRFTDREIREEYGLEAKPHNTLMENIFWLIVNEGPITPTEMAKKLGRKQADVSGFCARAYKRLGGDLIERNEKVRPFQYRALHTFSAEAGYRAFLERDDTGKKKDPSARKQALSAAAQPRQPGHTKPKKDDVVVMASHQLAEQVIQSINTAMAPFAEIERRLLERSSNGAAVKIEVTGTVRFLFGWN